MQAYKLTLKQLQDMLKDKTISSPEIVESILNRINEVDDKIKAFITVTDESARNQAKEQEKNPTRKLLSGIPYGLKDDICTKGIRTTAASKMLENFVPNYDATVVKRLKEEGTIIVGKLNMDELAIGSSTELSAFNVTLNPWDLTRVAGGSSGGAAAAVAADAIPFALGTDTGGSVRQPASFCGIVGFKPSYGRVSRWGVMSFTSSLDQVGILSKTVEDCAIVLGVIAGKDPLDSTSHDIAVPDYHAQLNGNVKGMKIAFPKEYFQNVDEAVKDAVMKALKKYEEMGAIIEEVSLPHTDYALPVYQLITSAEASTNLSRFDGVQFGQRDVSKDNIDDMYCHSRSNWLGAEVKRKILLGTYALRSGNYEEYYIKAAKIRRLIYDDFMQVFNNFDIIITPTTCTPAFKVGEQGNNLIERYANDALTVAASLAGLPAISIPCGFANGLPIGMQIIGKAFCEETVLGSAYAFEQSTDYHKQKPVLGVN